MLEIKDSDDTFSFYDYQECFDKIVSDNLLIKNIVTYSSQIAVYAEPNLDELVLRRLFNNDIDKAKNLIKENIEEFKEKSLWKGKKLYNMAENDLSTRKWKAYGYFDSNDNLISYADYKLRSDGMIELGILLTKKEFRKKGYGSSLVWLFKLKFATSDFVSGTYEENNEMISVFNSTNYTEDYSVNRTNFNEMTNKVPERRNPQTGEFTDNSIYYQSIRLFPFIKYRDKTK